MSHQDFPPNTPRQPGQAFQGQSAYQGQQPYQGQPPQMYQPQYGADRYQAPGLRRVNKILYILMSFFFGTFGVHRFMRGQVGIGILMLFVSWATFGLWQLIGFIIGLTKLSKYPGDDFVFTEIGNWA